MSELEREAWERRETSEELALVIRLAQEMAQRLAAKSHGALHGEVAALGGMLHDARRQLDLIGARLG